MSGRFSERVERLVKNDGELEQVLRRQAGLTDSELARTLASHLGENSPLMNVLDPEASDGFLTALAAAIEKTLKDQRELRGLGPKAPAYSTPRPQQAPRRGGTRYLTE